MMRPSSRPVIDDVTQISPPISSATRRHARRHRETIWSPREIADRRSTDGSTDSAPAPRLICCGDERGGTDSGRGYKATDEKCGIMGRLITSAARRPRRDLQPTTAEQQRIRERERDEDEMSDRGLQQQQQDASPSGRATFIRVGSSRDAV